MSWEKETFSCLPFYNLGNLCESFFVFGGRKISCMLQCHSRAVTELLGDFISEFLVPKTSHIRSVQGAISMLNNLKGCKNRAYVIDLALLLLNRESNAKVAADSERESLKRQLQTIESLVKKQSDEISSYKKEVRCNMPMV